MPFTFVPFVLFRSFIPIRFSFTVSLKWTLKRYLLSLLIASLPRVPSEGIIPSFKAIRSPLPPLQVLRASLLYCRSSLSFSPRSPWSVHSSGEPEWGFVGLRLRKDEFRSQGRGKPERMWISLSKGWLDNKLVFFEGRILSDFKTHGRRKEFVPFLSDSFHYFLDKLFFYARKKRGEFFLVNRAQVNCINIGNIGTFLNAQFFSLLKLKRILSRISLGWRAVKEVVLTKLLKILTIFWLHPYIP